MSRDSVENKKISRARKGEPLGYVPDEIIQGVREGEDREKVVRENVLNDVLELRKQGRSIEEIHAFGCEKYHFRDDNPWETDIIDISRKKGYNLSDVMLWQNIIVMNVQ